MMSKPESNHTPWYTVRVKELLDPPGNQTVRPRRTLIECYVSDLDRATFLFNQFPGIPDPAAEMARLRAVEEDLRTLLDACGLIRAANARCASAQVQDRCVREDYELSMGYACDQLTLKMEKIARRNAAKVGGGA
jgi:hypothetical protein